jgi:hypothetical protein
MTFTSIDASQRLAAKVAGFVILFSMAIVIFGEFYVSSGLLLPGNAVDTARNILAHETRFRIYIACDLVYGASVIVLLAALYMILKPVNRGLALVAAFFRLIFASMWVVMALNMLGALRLLGDLPYLPTFEAAQLQTLARLNLAGNYDAYYIGLPFFALASTACSYLWLKSRYIPRALSAFGMLSSGWCVICAFAFIVFPDFNTIVNDWWFDTPMGLFEMALGFWLLFKGLPPDRIAGSEAAANRAPDRAA